MSIFSCLLGLILLVSQLCSTVQSCSSSPFVERVWDAQKDFPECGGANPNEDWSYGVVFGDFNAKISSYDPSVLRLLKPGICEVSSFNNGEFCSTEAFETPSVEVSNRSGLPNIIRVADTKGCLALGMSSKQIAASPFTNTTTVIRWTVPRLLAGSQESPKFLCNYTVTARGFVSSIAQSTILGIFLNGVLLWSTNDFNHDVFTRNFTSLSLPQGAVLDAGVHMDATFDSGTTPLTFRITRSCSSLITVGIQEPNNISGFAGFTTIFVIAAVTALIWWLYEMQVERESKLFKTQLRLRDRVIYRFKTKQHLIRVGDSFQSEAQTKLMDKVTNLLLDSFLVSDVAEVALSTQSLIEIPLFKATAHAVWSFQLVTMALLVSLSKDDGTWDHEAPKSSMHDDQLLLLETAQLDVNIPASVDAAQKASDALQKALRSGIKPDILATGQTHTEEAMRRLPRYCLDSNISLSEIVGLKSEDAVWGREGNRFYETKNRSKALIPRFWTPSQSLRTDSVYQHKGHPIKKTREIISSYFPRFHLHPWFFGIFFLFLISIFLAFAGKSDRTKNGMDLNNRTAPGQVVGTQPFLLGGYGQTFLPVPPQYDLSRSTQNAWVPVLYGVMHCVLFLLGLLPIPFMRGFWRDIVAKWPNVRHWIPIDDFSAFHRLVGFSAFVGLLLGALIWLSVMGTECYTNGNYQSCIAFDTQNSDPVQNVLVLRFIVWCLWFPILPLMAVVRRGPWNWLPEAFHRYWFEVVYYSHILVALLTVLLALICRFTVFYPVLFGWIPYLLDSVRETLFHTVKLFIDPGRDRRFLTSSDRRPTSIRLCFKPTTKQATFGAGQWVYIQIPSIDFNWHPFSIANASSDSPLELHIGVIGGSTASREATTGEWYTKSGDEPWTFKLWKQMNVPNHAKDFPVYVRGPYGSAFTSCFDPKYDGAVVIGAGTGLTAAESVLRELFNRKALGGSNCPSQAWFVWSCRRVDDLLWCWDNLCDLLTQGILQNSLKADSWLQADYAHRFNMLDWLGVSFYVTQATSSDIEQFCEVKLQKGPDPIYNKVQEWLINQLVAGALDDEDAHIKKLLFSIQAKLSICPRRKSRLTVAFCGPSPLALVVSTAAHSMGGNVEFSADNQ